MMIFLVFSTVNLNGLDKLCPLRGVNSGMRIMPSIQLMPIPDSSLTPLESIGLTPGSCGSCKGAELCYVTGCTDYNLLFADKAKPHPPR